MGFRFRKSLGLLPGVKLNISKSGGSISLGGKGFSYNLGPKGNKATVGLPGSGMSYSSYASNKPGGTTNAGFYWVVAVVAIGLIARYVFGVHV